MRGPNGENLSRGPQPQPTQLAFTREPIQRHQLRVQMCFSLSLSISLSIGLRPDSDPRLLLHCT